MLVKLPDHSLITEEDRVRYTDGSISVTIWFDVDNTIFSFEIIFDLLLKEMALLYSKKSPPRYVKVEEEIPKFGHTKKQSIGSMSENLPYSRIIEFEQVSKCIPKQERNFMLKIMHLINKNSRA